MPRVLTDIPSTKRTYESSFPLSGPVPIFPMESRSDNLGGNVSMTRMKAIVFGATGMVGEGVLHECLKSAEVGSVLVIGRRSCGVRHPKLTEIIHTDYLDLSALDERLTGYNACFFCLGVSSLGMKEDEYRKITYDFTMAAANTLSSLNPDMTFCYVSGQGTDSSENGRMMWARVKGKTENDLLKLPFKSAYMFRPGYIRPTKGLRNAYRLSRALGGIYPVLKIIARNHVCTLEDLGLAMIGVTKEGYPRKVLENSDITSVGSSQKV